MDFNEYQDKAHTLAIYPTLYLPYHPEGAVNENSALPIEWIYPLIGLGGEVGELQNKLKKVIRDQNGHICHISCGDSSYECEYYLSEKAVTMDDIESEIGDVLWYIAELASVLGLDLDMVAKSNLEKLFKRKITNKISGSGDER